MSFLTNVINSRFLISFSNNSVSDYAWLLYFLSSPTLTIWLLINITASILFKKGKTICWWGYFFLLYYICFSRMCDSIAYVVLSTIKINVNLQNGLLLIHPAIIYYLYGYTIVRWSLFFYQAKPRFVTNTSRLYCKIILAILGIVLGSFWAAQELNWGGFWSWDPVELSSTIVLVFIIYSFHLFPEQFYKQNKTHTLLFYIILIYVLVRLGVVTTVHSFIRGLTLPIYLYFITMVFTSVYSVILVKRLSPTTAYTIGKNIIPENTHGLYYSITKLLLLVITICLTTLVITSLFTFTQQLFVHPALGVILIIYFTLYYMVLLRFGSLYTDLITKSFLLMLIYLVFNSIVISLIFTGVITALYFRKYSYTHVGLLTLIMINHLFLTSINMYSIGQFVELLNLSVSKINFALTSNTSYENFFLLKKHFYLMAFKTVDHHIMTFSLLGNPLCIVFSFVKNNVVHNLFCEEFPYITIIIWVLGMCYSFILYKGYTTKINKYLCYT